jgi:outer membrane protein assembly factor BamB
MKNLITALLVSSFAMPALAQNTFHGNVARTGVYPGSAPAKAAGIQWSFNTGGPIVGSAAIADGVVYVASLSAYLYALDQQSGAKKWEFKSRMPIASSPAVADGLVYFVSSTGALAAIDAKTGQPAWVFPGEFEKKFEAKGLHGYPNAGQVIPDAWDFYTSSPAVANGKVYFGTGDGNVYAVDAKSGILQWKFTTGDVVHASPSVAGSTVYIGSYDGNFYALDADSGAQKWVFEAGRDAVMHNQVGFQSSAAVVDGTVYVGCRDAHVYALDAATGRKKWDYPTSKSWVNTTPAVRDGIVYAGTSDSSRFLALDAKTGRLRWVFDAKAYIFSSPALAGGLALFGNFNGRLYAVNTATGALAWEFQTEVSKQDRLKVVNADGSLNQDSFAPTFGDFQDMYVDFYRYVSVGAIVASPVIDQGVVYVGSMDGNLYALH